MRANLLTASPGHCGRQELLSAELHPAAAAAEQSARRVRRRCRARGRRAPRRPTSSPVSPASARSPPRCYSPRSEKTGCATPPRGAAGRGWPGACHALLWQVTRRTHRTQPTVWEGDGRRAASARNLDPAGRNRVRRAADQRLQVHADARGEGLRGCRRWSPRPSDLAEPYRFHLGSSSSTSGDLTEFAVESVAPILNGLDDLRGFDNP